MLPNRAFRSKVFQYFQKFLCLPFILFSLSCASAPVLQPQINSLVASQRFHYARRLLEEHKESYGKNNELLYLLDYGLVLHLAGDYKGSIQKFEKAKKVYDSLYTTSVSKQFKTWLINDYYAPYRGEDFERVMINIFQALNYTALGGIDEALVEARDVNETLKAMNDQYAAPHKSKYQEEAFARFMMGILYEHKGTLEGYNDAYISYKKAFEAYSQGVSGSPPEIPVILQQNLIAAAKFMGEQEHASLKAKIKNVTSLTLEEKKKVAEVYLVYYYGLSPIKHQADIPVPLPNGFYTKLAFPHYDKRKVGNEPENFKAVHIESNKEFEERTIKVQDISGIAESNLKDRRTRVIAKAVLRSGGKYFAESQIEENLERSHGNNTADVFRYVASIYNISSEQADLRSWQTLPGEIRLARLWLQPGEYHLYVGKRFLGRYNFLAGSKEYFILRTTR